MTDSPKKSPALWKQLCGACGGALVALGVYAGYQWGGEHLSGYLTPPGWEGAAVPVPLTPREISHNAALELQMYEMEKVASEAASLAAQMSASSAGSNISATAVSSMDANSSESQTSSAPSSGRVQWRTGSRWSAPAEPLPQSTALPDTGLPLVGVIGAALGGAIVRRRGRKA